MTFKASLRKWGEALGVKKLIKMDIYNQIRYKVQSVDIRSGAERDASPYLEDYDLADYIARKLSSYTETKAYYVKVCKPLLSLADFNLN